MQLDDADGQHASSADIVKEIFSCFGESETGTLSGAKYHLIIELLAKHMDREYREDMEQKFVKMRKNQVSEDQIEQARQASSHVDWEFWRDMVQDKVDVDRSGEIGFEKAVGTFAEVVDLIEPSRTPDA